MAFPATTRCSPLDPHAGPDAVTPTSAAYALDCELKSWKEPSPPGVWQPLHTGPSIVVYISLKVAVAGAESPMSPRSASGAAGEPPPHASVQSKQTATHAAPPRADLGRKDEGLVLQQPRALAVSIQA